MPWPVLTYQLPLGRTPARAHRASSLALVPEASARDANGACAAAIALNAADGAPARHVGRVVPGPQQDEVVVHHRRPAQPVALRHVRLLRGGRVHQQHVGVPLGAHGQRLPGPHRDGLDPAAAAGLVRRHQRVEQARVLGARRGAEDERPAGRARGRAATRGAAGLTTVARAAGAPAAGLGPPQPATSTMAAATAQTPPARAEPPTPSPWCGRDRGRNPHLDVPRRRHRAVAS